MMVIFVCGLVGAACCAMNAVDAYSSKEAAFWFALAALLGVAMYHMAVEWGAR